jgi:hypothetical protein
MFPYLNIALRGACVCLLAQGAFAAQPKNPPRLVLLITVDALRGTCRVGFRGSWANRRTDIARRQTDTLAWESKTMEAL